MVGDSQETAGESAKVCDKPSIKERIETHSQEYQTIMTGLYIIQEGV
jgi:hypothetical protein